MTKRYAVWVEIVKNGEVRYRNFYDRYWTRFGAKRTRDNLQRTANLMNDVKDLGTRQKWYIVYKDRDGNEILV